MSKRSEVWNYFKKTDRNKEEAVCIICAKILGCKGSSTTPLLNHLKIHKITINKNSFTGEENVPCVSKKPKISSNLLNYVKRESLEEILSRCVAEDGFSIYSLTKSRAIMGYIQSKGFEMPKSPNTVTKHIINFCNNKKNDLKKKIDNLKKNNVKFSLTVDEWTDNCMKRYLNVSLHFLSDSDHLIKKIDVYVLGLVEIKGCCNAEQTKFYVENKLKEFNLVTKSDVISSTHDGAAVMIKYGQILDVISQLCYNHALHLSVMDTFYKRHSPFVDEDEDVDDLDSVDDEIEELDEINDVLNIDGDDANLNVIYEFIDESHIKENFDDVFRNLRKIIRLFKTSSVKNSILQDHVTKQEGKPLKLLLDIKTRWSSIIIMVDRFLKIKDCVNKTLEELDQPIISDDHILILQDVQCVLSPLKAAVKELSKNSATLLTAEGIYKFLFDKMEEIKSELSNLLLFHLQKRMNERRDKTLLTLMIFLETGNIPRSNKYFEYSTKTAAINLAVEIMEKIHPAAYANSISDIVSGEDTECVEFVENNIQLNGQSSLHQQLQQAISSITYVDGNRTDNNMQSGLRKDFLLLTNTKERSKNLKILYNALLTIKPTSTATERVFSTAGNFKTKLRTRLNFETFDAILFLKYYFLKMK